MGGTIAQLASKSKISRHLAVYPKPCQSDVRGCCLKSFCYRSRQFRDKITMDFLTCVISPLHNLSV